MKLANPNFYFSGEIIVGFNHETEEDFNETLEMIELFNELLVFKCDPMPRTPAFSMGGAISSSVKENRVREIRRLAKEKGVKCHSYN